MSLEGNDLKDVLRRKVGEVMLSNVEQVWLLSHLSTLNPGEELQTKHLQHLARNIDRETRKQVILIKKKK